MGQIVSFYSFKGGTGRSTTLSNVAYELAKRGAKVGCMDFDLSAPGLHWIFDVSPGQLQKKGTIHEYLNSKNSGSKDIEEYVVDIDNGISDDDLDGELYLMRGGINAEVASELLVANKMFDDMKPLVQRFDANYNLDYLFLDSRSGISNQAMPIFRAADDIIVFSKWTYQHKTGTDELINWIFEVEVPISNQMCVASNVPDNISEEQVNDWVLDELHHQITDHEVVYESEKLKEEERVLTKEEPESDPAKSYKEIADWLEDN